VDDEVVRQAPLFAALDVLEGKIIGRCMQRHRHQEFIRFLNAIEAQVPARKSVHVILDNYAAHKHPKVAQWLDRHPRFADFFYTAVSTAFVSPPGDILAHSRGARAATIIEMLTAFALVTAYASSFLDFQRPSASEDLG